MIANPLIYRNGTYQIDFADLEQKKSCRPKCKGSIVMQPA